MSGFVLHPDALTDLAEIWEYIAADSPSAPTVSLVRSKKRFAPSCHFLNWATSVLI